MSTASDDVPPELVDRFKAALERLNPEGARLGLAVSGGPDSMAMLLLAHAAIPGRFEVATVDHGLRPEAKEECALVVAACEARGVPCEVLTVEVGEGNVQAMARKARYEALLDWAARRGLDGFATAHHADDQAETLLMRLNRGCGVEGLSSIRHIRQFYVEKHDADVYLLRPLLEFTRAELAQIIDGAGIKAAHDPSNLDDSFDRVRIRKAMAGIEGLDPLRLAKAADNLEDAADAIAWAATREIEERLTKRDRLLRYDRAGSTAPRAVLLLVVRRLLEQLGAQARGAQIADLVERLMYGEGGNLGGVLVTIENGDWVFGPEPPRKSG